MDVRSTCLPSRACIGTSRICRWRTSSASRSFDGRVAVNNADLLGRWTHTLQNGSGMSLQFFYDHVNRLDQNTIEVSNTIDFDFQHHLPAGKRQDIVWGLGYRRTNDSLTPGYDITFDPPKRSDSLYSTFFQDEITIANSLSLTVGSKFEHNAYSGF